MDSLYKRVGGAETCKILSDHFHDAVEDDPELRAFFTTNFSLQRDRLSLYLAEAWGGPKEYRANRGKNSLVCRHAHLKIGPSEVNQWLAAMDKAIGQLELPMELAAEIRDYFSETALTLGDPLTPFYALGLDELEDALTADPGLARGVHHGRSLLKRASMDWDVERVSLLIARGAEPHAVDRLGHDALYYACNARFCEREMDGVTLVRCLIQAGADVNKASGPKRVTPLHVTARRGTVPLAKILIEAGAQLEATDSQGVTPLQRAINCRHHEMAAYLRSAHQG